jgi:hypothetical protein
VDQGYLIRVIANNNEGDSLPTESVYGYASSIPSSLSMLTIVQRGTDFIVLGWTPPTSTLPIIGYKVYQNQADNKPPSILVYDGSSFSTILQTQISKLITGAIYQFSFTALNYVGES